MAGGAVCLTGQPLLSRVPTRKGGSGADSSPDPRPTRAKRDKPECGATHGLSQWMSSSLVAWEGGTDGKAIPGHYFQT